MSKAWLCVALALWGGLLMAGEFEIKDEAEFAKIVPQGAKVEVLADNMGFVEGPVWIGTEGGFLVFSDIPGNELKKWTPKEDGLATFRKPSENINGNFLDLEGRLISCHHGSRRVTRTEKDGSITTLADSYNGKKLNSPNDLVMKTDGSIWFTDPPYGIDAKQQEQPKNYVFRLDPKTKELRAVAEDFDRPNGLCFSPEEKRLYIADSSKLRHIRVFEVKEGGTLSGGEVFCVIDKGGPDGIRCDTEGRLYSSAGDGVHIFNPAGKLIGKILTPQITLKNKQVRESPANLCFGGPDKKTLYMTARTSLYSITLSTTGAQKP